MDSIICEENLTEKTKELERENRILKIRIETEVLT